jgi:hypothetical protein
MADILILANSKKNRGYCVAGKDIQTNRWMRIVGDQPGSELSLAQTAYTDITGKTRIQPFEPFNKIVRVPLGAPAPLVYQPENILIGQTPWQEIQVTQSSISYDTPPDLWGPGDRIISTDIQERNVHILQSLYYIQVSHLQFYVNDYNGNRACFQYGENYYDLGATMNPIIFQALMNGQLPHNNIITVSLAGAFRNKYSQQDEHYKLVAAVF